MTDSPPIVALLDANVLVPAAIRDTLLRLGFNGLFEPRWSDSILEEVQRTLVNDGFTDARRAARLIQTMTARFPDATVRDFEHLIETMTNHPGDRHVLAAAVEVGASVIVTDNTRHFRANDLASHAILAQTPDRFLCDRLHEQQDAIISLLRLQASMLQAPPTTIHDVLNRLRVHAPTFVEQVAAKIEPRSGR